jgi:hypothetical protein
VHGVVPAGGIAQNGLRWIRCRPGFFLSVRVLSRVFRGKFVAGLKQAAARGELAFHGRLAELAHGDHFEQLLNRAVRQDWVVYAKRPFGGPRQVLKYLARYTHRVAISNRRLRALRQGQVTFRWKDYARGDRQRWMTLSAVEFIRRFLLHVLPSGFMKIRHYGFMANRARTTNLELLRRLLSLPTALSSPSTDPQMECLLGRNTDDPSRRPCPHCRHGRLRIIQQLPP